MERNDENLISSENDDISAAFDDNLAWSDPAYTAVEDKNVYSPNHYGKQSAYSYSPSAERGPIKQGGNTQIKPAFIVLICALVSIIVSVSSAWIVTSMRLGGRSVVIGSNLNLTDEITQNTVPRTESALAANQIYELGLKQVVGINSETTTNIFGQPTSRAVTGSGFIISEDGYILTNYHVIEYSVLYNYTLKALTSDGTQYDCKIIGYDQQNDIAVVKIEADGLSAVSFGNSDELIVGEKVYPIGNPLGELLYSMTGGIVSALDRDISTDSAGSISVFQFDAAVNRGNSGGPVYNEYGEVIGIVTAKYSAEGVEGLGFAIPINDILDKVTELIETGYIGGLPSLGVTLQTMDASYAAYYNVPQGAYVRAVLDGSCAKSAGIRIGDIITAFNGRNILSKEDLVSAISELKAGDSAKIQLFRSGSTMEVSVVLDEKTPSLNGV